MIQDPSFTKDLFRFLVDLRKNNNRDWFQASKPRYEQHVQEPALEFVSDFAPLLEEISPHFRADPRPAGGSLFRIYRDVRFSKDKSPYKTVVGIRFRHELGKDAHAPVAGRSSPDQHRLAPQGGCMKLLLTSAGIKNTSIHAALVDLLGKPIAEANALCIPTAGYGHPHVSPDGAWRFISGREPRTPMCELGWRSLGVLELTALPSIEEERWVPWVRETDVLLVNGGDALYLCHWMRQSGLADLLPSLRETVWVGLSAGSMVMTPRIGEDFVGWRPPTGSDRTLGIVDFSIFPHVDHKDLPENTMAHAERWAASLAGPAYAIDDETAIKVTDGTVEVVSEGQWKLFTP